MRLFTAIRMPKTIQTRLAGLATSIPGAIWSREENLHLTLCFIGEVDDHSAEDIDSGLSAIRAPAFSLTLEGSGHFGERKPRALWIGVRPCPPLMHLRAKVQTALERAGHPGEKRKFTPHITLARLRDAPKDKVARFVTANAMFVSEPIPVGSFTLFSSKPGKEKSHYEIERSYPLERAKS